MTLKWCTPRGSSAENHLCTSMHRITPVEVNSRPSSCLINFLLNGRSVMLEMSRKHGGKLTSHMLACHGGEIFIHTLCTARYLFSSNCSKHYDYWAYNSSRSVLEDPPSISEGCGGRVTDYRITDFGHFIQQNKIQPLKRKLEDLNAIQRMKVRLDRQTNFWPMTINSTILLNLKSVSQLINVLFYNQINLFYSI